MKKDKNEQMKKKKENENEKIPKNISKLSRRKRKIVDERKRSIE